MEPVEFLLPQQIKEVYDQLGLVLKEPRAFGLVQQAPHQLTDALRSMRQKLREAMRMPMPSTGRPIARKSCRKILTTVRSSVRFSAALCARAISRGFILFNL